MPPVQRSPRRNALIAVWVGVSALFGLCLFGLIASIFVLGLVNPAVAVDEGGAAISSIRDVEEVVAVPGAGIALALPAGMEQADAVSDEYSGNWWYISETTPIQVFIAATRWDGGAPEITERYLREAVAQVEESSGNTDLVIETTAELEVGGYAGRQAHYRSTSSEGQREYNAVLLIGREEDDVFIAVYGPESEQVAIDQLAARLQDSLVLEPTPGSYSLTDI